MLAGYGEFLLAAALAGFAFVQWLVSYRADNLQRARQRDAEMAAWGGQVVDLMAELETACAPLAPDFRPTLHEFERIASRASALVDRGRFFFPNVLPYRASADGRGYRVEILDHVLRACYVAQHLASGGKGDPYMMRHQVWQARRRFIELLQLETKQSLRRVQRKHAGKPVPLDPNSWETPAISMRLPNVQVR